MSSVQSDKLCTTVVVLTTYQLRRLRPGPENRSGVAVYLNDCPDCQEFLASARQLEVFSCRNWTFFWSALTEEALMVRIAVIVALAAWVR